VQRSVICPGARFTSRPAQLHNLLPCVHMSGTRACLAACPAGHILLIEALADVSCGAPTNMATLVGMPAVLCLKLIFAPLIEFCLSSDFGPVLLSHACEDCLYCCKLL
jgi:hypothetical protein